MEQTPPARAGTRIVRGNVRLQSHKPSQADKSFLKISSGLVAYNMVNQGGSGFCSGNFK